MCIFCRHCTTHIMKAVRWLRDTGSDHQKLMYQTHQPVYSKPNLT
jgi:hypothetical protein